MTIWVVLPAYNEAPRLPALLERWVKVLEAEPTDHRYVIVDDGSVDDTGSILKRFAPRHPAEIITHSPNQGLGVAMRHAFRRVADRSGDGDLVVAMDADNTQPPELLPEMLKCMQQTRCDVVIASRYRHGASVEGLSRFRRFLSFGARLLFQVVFPIRGVRDYTCGFRLYRAAVIKRAFEVYGERFCDRSGFESAADIVLRLAALGATFREVPLPLRYAAKEAGSHMAVGRTVRRTVALMIRRRFSRGERA